MLFNFSQIAELQPIVPKVAGYTFLFRSYDTMKLVAPPSQLMYIKNVSFVLANVAAFFTVEFRMGSHCSKLNPSCCIVSEDPIPHLLSIDHGCSHTHYTWSQRGSPLAHSPQGLGEHCAPGAQCRACHSRGSTWACWGGEQ